MRGIIPGHLALSSHIQKLDKVKFAERWAFAEDDDVRLRDLIWSEVSGISNCPFSLATNQFRYYVYFL